jgi:hypothetical protein
VLTAFTACLAAAGEKKKKATPKKAAGVKKAAPKKAKADKPKKAGEQNFPLRMLLCKSGMMLQSTSCLVVAGVNYAADQRASCATSAACSTHHASRCYFDAFLTHVCMFAGIFYP